MGAKQDEWIPQSQIFRGNVAQGQGRKGNIKLKWPVTGTSHFSLLQ
jgi:hypothetical protein